MGLAKGQSHRRRRLFAQGIAAVWVFAGASCFATPTPAPRPPLRLLGTPAPAATALPTRSPEPLPALPRTPTPVPSYPITTTAVGETIAVGDLVMTVIPLPAPDTALDPETGRRLVLLDLTIRNVGKRLVGINAARELVLKDNKDQVYQISPEAVAAIRGTIPDVDVAPGETIRAQVGFEVPIDSSGLVLTFGADKFQAGKIFVQLP